jgi:hypothetical protein
MMQGLIVLKSHGLEYDGVSLIVVEYETWDSIKIMDRPDHPYGHMWDSINLGSWIMYTAGESAPI